MRGLDSTEYFNLPPEEVLKKQNIHPIDGSNYTNIDRVNLSENQSGPSYLAEQATKFIRKHQKKGVSRGRARFVDQQKAKGRRRGHGRRKGGKNARTPSKKKWMSKIRALRDELKNLRDEKKVTASQYRKYYLRSKGGLYNSRAHLLYNLKVDGVLKEEK